MAEIPLSRLVSIRDAKEVWPVVADTVHGISPLVDLAPVRAVYNDVLRLFAGQYPGYRACNTVYHDLRHTTDTLLAMARLLHGATAAGERVTDRAIQLGLIAALLHDTGYIQESDDTEGTGAKYTDMHVERSIRFAGAYLDARGFPEADRAFCRHVILCTELIEEDEVPEPPSAEADLLGKMLATADLLGQMATRTYLEKLLFLFYEFQEGRVGRYKSEFDLLEQTLDFCQYATERLESRLGGVHRFMREHFRARWGLEEDPYAEGMAHQAAYLRNIIENHPDDYRRHLKREGLIEKLNDLYRK
ncbi:MAG: HD domain-containing protein [Planctomycetota bacterium]